MRVDQIKDDPSTVAFLRANAPYIGFGQLARMAMGRHSERWHLARIKSFVRACKEVGITLRSAADVIEIPEEAKSDLNTVNGVPEGFALSLWARGAVITLASPIPGIKGVTRHYAD